MLDIIFLVLLIIGSYSGYKKGFILEIIGFIAFFLGLYGALKLLNWSVGIVIRIFPNSGNIVPFIMFLVVFIIIIILVNLLGRILKRFIDMTILGAFDNIAGAILGFFMWALSISFLLWILNRANINIPEKQIQNSYVYPHIVNLAPTIGGYLSSLFPFAESLIKEVKEIFTK
jgi:membrane protein required for colicin V production